jgi:hypothetical protein
MNIMNSNSLDISPENKRLQERYQLLKTEFSTLFQEIDAMLVYEKNYFTAVYLERIGRKKYELFCLQTEVSTLKLKQSLIQSYLNRNEKPNLSRIEATIEKEFDTYFKQIEEQAQNLKAAQDYLATEFLTPEEAQELKTLYRTLVKRLHPDINHSLSERDKVLFQQVQAAYKLCDLTKMRELILLLDCSIEWGEMPVTIDRQFEIEQLEAKIAKYKDDIARLNQLFPFTLREKLFDEEWVEQELLQIEEKISRLLQEKEQLVLIIELQLS